MRIGHLNLHRPLPQGTAGRFRWKTILQIPYTLSITHPRHSRQIKKSLRLRVSGLFFGTFDENATPQRLIIPFAKVKYFQWLFFL